MPPRRDKRADDEQDLMRLLYEYSSDPVHLVGADGRFRLVNDAWLRATGWSREDVIGNPALDFAILQDGADGPPMLAALEPGVILERYAQVRTKDGGFVWMATRVQRLPTGDYLTTMRDATEERRRMAELEEERRTRKLLASQAGLGVWEYDLQSNSIWWSEELAQRINFDSTVPWSPEEFYARIHPRDRAQLLRTMTGALETGAAAQSEHRVWTGEAWITMRATVRPEMSDDGRYTLKGISEDITELAAARDAARQSAQRARKARREALTYSQRLKLALAAAGAGVYQIDHVARTFWCSPEFRAITGRRIASYKDANELRFPGFHPDDLGHVRESFRGLQSGDHVGGRSFEARIVRPDGEVRWVRVHHHQTFTRDGRRWRAVGLVQDCDAAKRQELALREAQRAAEEAAEAKSAFLANMSHEIRTPLNGVMGVMHLLKSESLTDEGRGLLGEAVSCGQMLAELLNDVIDFSKIEAGRLELDVQPVDIAALVGGVGQLLMPQAAAKGLALRVEIAPDIGWASADPVRLRQALFNLAGNAVKFTQSGYVAIRARRVTDKVLRLEVQDTGIGISQTAQQRLFQRFSQADASTTRRFGGSGLGLAITRRLADMMDGHVGLTSAEGAGSTFWLEVAAPVAQPEAPAPDLGEDLLSGVRMLVVEDNPTNRLIATKMLENLGASVATAADGYEGVEAVAAGGFDLVLMDIQMPGIDGVEATRRIRALGGEAAGTPIIALTANVLAHQRREYLGAGMDGVVGKPIMPEALIAEIARVAAGAPQADSAAQST